MVFVLIDTCVWLDLAKDYEQQRVLNALEELVQRKDISLLVPDTIINEFQRNKARVIQEIGKSLSGHFKRVRDILVRHGDPKKKQDILDQLNDIDYRIPFLGESAETSLDRIEKLLNSTATIEISNEMKLRAANRAIEKKAPFHKSKNSINDAIIIETYLDYLQNKNSAGNKFMFVTHNTKDFSIPDGNDKIPHPDFANYFSKRKSQYFIKLSEALYKVNSGLITESMIEEEWIDEPRSLSEILEAENELFDKIWHNRHRNWLYKIKTGQHEIVENEEYTRKPSHKKTPVRVFEDARNAAKKVEKKYGVENVGPWDDFELGMLNGKLSALRWVNWK